MTSNVVELPENFSLAICVPSGDNVNASFMKSVVDMCILNRLPIASYSNARSSRVAYNRNKLVDEARAAKASHMLFIDADTLFPASALLRLISHGKEIVGATATRRNDDDAKACGWTLDGQVFQSAELRKMKMMGFPLMLIDMKVFDKMRAPWFAEPPYFMMPGYKAEDAGLMAEDEYFCHNALQAGLDIWCDVELSLHIGHQGTKTYYIARKEQPKMAIIEKVA